MRQHDRDGQALGADELSLVRVQCQIHQMRDLLCDARRVDPTHRKHTTDNGILIAVGDITAGHSDVAEEETRVRAELARVQELVSRDGRLQPLRADNGDQRVAGLLVLGEIDRGGDDVRELLDGREWRGGIVHNDLAAAAFDLGAQLALSSITDRSLIVFDCEFSHLHRNILAQICRAHDADLALAQQRGGFCSTLIAHGVILHQSSVRLHEFME